MLSGVRLSCYQEYGSSAKPITARVSTSLNLPNLNSLTCSRETPSRWTTAARPQTQQTKPALPAWRARP
ncbi:hypothetical protein C0053_03040 [Pseudomonas aeruginosa]|nr:hypothetical protein CD800_35475 [Pseudomonas aeruginosa]NMY21982.1 hypothetical protein [Pseudomonas sp. WS 5410]PEI08291.1 hypothetical protein CRM86_10555 [Pseudomonas putida]MBF3018232.1 hypothetical protein [Pseudomonas aeruginosa]NAS56153.1 hypothetical protein [Pseudomonas aeruginosa]